MVLLVVMHQASFPSSYTYFISGFAKYVTDKPFLCSTESIHVASTFKCCAKMRIFDHIRPCWPTHGVIV